MSAACMAERWAGWWRSIRLNGRAELDAEMRQAAGDDIAISNQLVRIGFSDGSEYLEKWTPPDVFSDAVRTSVAESEAAQAELRG